MLNKIMKKMQKAGFDAQILNYKAGDYYDETGTDHAFYYKRLYICPETWTEHEIAHKAVNRMLRGVLKDEYTVEYIPFSKAFTVIARKDAQQAKAAADESKAFLEAFWQYMHDQPHDENGRLTVEAMKAQDEAVKAGQAAVKAWKEGRAA